ncbi:COR domain-containing protein [Candidatus Uabimicrobium sp. HlEnr_7]|uniref:COR domain-containing protein n=1 Tax=Candidatus Uabimicrobium helgolandensis TaxID=3095367 RepID=UPI0035568152
MSPREIVELANDVSHYYVSKEQIMLSLMSLNINPHHIKKENNYKSYIINVIEYLYVREKLDSWLSLLSKQGFVFTKKWTQQYAPDNEIENLIEKAIQEQKQELNLNSRGLDKIPLAIGDAQRLRDLDISKNQLSELPNSISNLINIEYLKINNNLFSKFPNVVLQLSNLKYLDIANNNIRKLPPEISKLSKLESLIVRNNPIERIPLELRILNNLSYFDIEGTPLSAPEIASKKPNEIIHYLLDLQNESSSYLREAKVIFAGAGTAGKTSLIKKLIFDKYNPQEPKTEGIEIYPWKIESKIHLNFWDFGGQEIMHAPHQFFMTERSIYILAVDPRLQGNKYGKEETDYWLKMINSYGGDSPIILVVTKSDLGKIRFPKTQLMDNYPNIKACIDVSCETNCGIQELKNKISEVVVELEHLDTKYPRTYLLVKKELEEKNENYISYYEYQNICRKVDPDMDETSMRILIGLLHDLGTMLNFYQDRHLADTQVLNPEWVTEGVYKIITSKELIANKGILSLDQISKILPPKFPTLKERGFIMDLMERFELCYQLPTNRDTFFIPSGFSQEPPASWPSEVNDKSVRFQFQYDILPDSIISYFMVSVHPFIHDDLYWVNGVIIYHEKNYACVEANFVKRTIDIEVWGEKNKRATLTYIRTQFTGIHTRFRGLEITEYVPVKNARVEYKQLVMCEEEQLDRLPVPGAGMINVHETLEGLRDLNPISPSQVDQLADDCVTELKKAIAESALRQLNIQPTRIADDTDLKSYYVNIIQYLVSRRLHREWLLRITRKGLVFAKVWYKKLY